MKKFDKAKFFIVAGLIALVTWSAFYGVQTQYGDLTKTYIKGANDIRWGIDIRGGVDVTFSPADGYDATPNEMSMAEGVVKLRLLSQNITDSEVYTDVDNDRIIVRFPWKSDETNFDPEQAIAELGSTSLLTFRYGTDTDADGNPTGEVILEGRHVVEASPTPQTDEYGRSSIVVALELDKEGAEAFSKATAALAGSKGQISIWMDNQMISAPQVESHISDGKAVISGSFTAESAAELANRINDGALPFKLQTENFSTISPTLGLGAKDAMLLAGVIAFAIVAVMMLVRYRVPGLVAIIALLGQVGLTVASITGFLPSIPSFTLTLPGIAGIILGVGFGVDANIITAERIKEELRSGKTLDSAITSGFQRAFTAILDGNATVIIVAIILMGSFGPPSSFFAQILKPVFTWFGPTTAGSIYSFGYTLMVGVILNMLMGVLSSRIMLKSISQWKCMRNPVLYGALPEGKVAQPKKDMGFTAKRKLAFGISLTMVAVTLAASLLMGVHLDIQFKGGAILTYSFQGELPKEEFEATVSNTLGKRINLQEQADVITGGKNYVVSLAGNDGISAEDQLALSQALETAYPENQVEAVSINVVDPVIGKEFLAKCVVAVAFASLLMICYIGLRFKKISGWSAGVVAVVALLHDVIAVFACFVLLRFSINDSFIAVALTILGYSLNDTIVIYDRIRENKRLYGGKLSLPQIVDRSISQSFTRSITTTATTVAAMGVVVAVALYFNLNSMLSFALPMIVGMLSGFYSSVFVTGPLWSLWQEKKAAQKA